MIDSLQQPIDDARKRARDVIAELEALVARAQESLREDVQELRTWDCLNDIRAELSVAAAAINDCEDSFASLAWCEQADRAFLGRDVQWRHTPGAK